jgi:hypothetical protein
VLKTNSTSMFTFLVGSVESNEAVLSKSVE